MFLKSRIALCLLSLLICISVVMAQDEEPHPLFEMLAIIPNAPIIETGTIHFSDFNAIEAARPAAGKYESWAEYEADQDSLEAGLWLNSIFAFGAFNGRGLPQIGAQIPEVMGFDVFDVDTSLVFGDPVEGAQIFSGGFDRDAIDTALTGQGFVRDELNDFEVWCSPEGCDMGTFGVLAENNRANLFGGNLGRKQPTALIDNYLFSSPTDSTVSTILATHSGEQPSLLENPFYVAAAEALTQEGLLRQVMFIPVNLWAEYDAFESELAAEIRAAADPLPYYQLTFLADVATETDQQAVIGLVFNTVEEAETAAAVLPLRLEVATSVDTGELWTAMLDTMDAVIEAPEIYEAENGTAVILLKIHYPTAPDTVNDAGTLTQTGIVFTWLMRSFAARDLLWLGTEPG